MRSTDRATLRVLVPLTAVLLVGVVAAAVQQDDDGPGESVVQATPTVHRTPAATPTTPRSTVSPPPSQTVGPTPTTPPTDDPVVPTTVPPVAPRTVPPTQVPSATPTPTPSSTPAPFDPGPKTNGMTALDGVQLQVQVDRSAARVGDAVTVTTTVTNNRPTAIVYKPTCPSKVTVRAATGANAQPSVEWTGDKQTFKDLALSGLVDAGNAFAPAKPAVCASGSAAPVDLAPQKTLVEQFTWRAQTAYGSAYDGQAPVTASFSFALDRGTGLAGPDYSTVESSAPLRLIGEGSGVVPPTVAIDAALSIAQFATFVEEGDSAVWEPPYAAGSVVGAKVEFLKAARSTYTVTLTRPDMTASVRVLADTGTPISISVKQTSP